LLAPVARAWRWRAAIGGRRRSSAALDEAALPAEVGLTRSGSNHAVVASVHVHGTAIPRVLLGTKWEGEHLQGLRPIWDHVRLPGGMVRHHAPAQQCGKSRLSVHCEQCGGAAHARGHRAVPPRYRETGSTRRDPRVPQGSIGSDRTRSLPRMPGGPRPSGSRPHRTALCAVSDTDIRDGSPSRTLAEPSTWACTLGQRHLPPPGALSRTCWTRSRSEHVDFAPQSRSSITFLKACSGSEAKELLLNRRRE
jgi:hypothetical protein